MAARVRVASFRVAIAVTTRSAIACSSALPPREKVRVCVSRAQGAHALLIEILSPSLNTIPAPSNDGLHHAGCVRDGWRVRCRSRQQLEGDRGSGLERPAAPRPFGDWREACGLPRGLMSAEHTCCGSPPIRHSALLNAPRTDQFRASLCSWRRSRPATRCMGREDRAGFR